MDFVLPAEDDQRRGEVRAWLADHPRPAARQLAEAGYVAPHWPVPYGLGADPVHQLIIDDELDRAGVHRPVNPIGVGWAGPTILYAGTPEQMERYLLPMLAGEEIWCQLFSEPGAGSDLAGLSTRAVLDGDEWVVNGQKIWTSGAQLARFGILIARTDPDVPKHRGISYFICPMDLPGIEIRPIRTMTGVPSFNEVFFTDVRIPAANLVGAVNDGWRLAKVTLGNERVSLSTGGVLWGSGPTALDLLEAVRAAGPVTSAVDRQRLAGLYIEHTILELIRLRTVTARLKGDQPGPEASVRKILADEHGQHVMAVARGLVGAWALLSGGDGVASSAGGPAEDDLVLSPYKPQPDLHHRSWHSGFLFSQALTIGGGTGEVQRNIVAERALGLPRGDGVGYVARPEPGTSRRTKPMAETTLGGNTVNTVGDLPEVGAAAPDFTLVAGDLSSISLSDLAGQRVVLNIFPSLDTAVCAASVRHFNEVASSLENTTVLNVSMDLPFAQARFCGTEGLADVVNGSDFRDHSFGNAYGVRMVDGRLAGLFARAVVVIDEQGIVTYVELVPQIAQEPDYDGAIAALG